MCVLGCVCMWWVCLCVGGVCGVCVGCVCVCCVGVCGVYGVCVWVCVVCVCAALDTQHAMNMQHAAICGLSGCTIYLSIIS
jgi:hypothetical protein